MLGRGRRVPAAIATIEARSCGVEIPGLSSCRKKVSELVSGINFLARAAKKKSRSFCRLLKLRHLRGGCVCMCLWLRGLSVVSPVYAVLMRAAEDLEATQEQCLGGEAVVDGGDQSTGAAGVDLTLQQV